MHVGDTSDQAAQHAYAHKQRAVRGDAASAVRTEPARVLFACSVRASPLCQFHLVCVECVPCLRFCVARSLASLKISGSFSIETAHAWVSRCLPEVPERCAPSPNPQQTTPYELVDINHPTLWPHCEHALSAVCNSGEPGLACHWQLRDRLSPSPG